MHRKSPFHLKAAATLLALACQLPAHADEPNKDEATLYLGNITIVGQQKIVNALRAIKLALHTPYSDDPAHADDVVCRINKGLGEQHEYLDCATNKNYSRRRGATQVAVLVGTYGIPDHGVQQMFAAMIATQPNHALHVPVQGGALQALLAQVPDDARVVEPGEDVHAVPAAGTVTAPSGATGGPTDRYRAGRG